MYVRLWKHPQSRDAFIAVSDRPVAIADHDGTPHVEWRRDPTDRGLLTLDAVQLFNDDGTVRSSRQVFDPPWCVIVDLDDGPPERWTYRLPWTLFASGLPHRGA